MYYKYRCNCIYTHTQTHIYLSIILCDYMHIYYVCVQKNKKYNQNWEKKIKILVPYSCFPQMLFVSVYLHGHFPFKLLNLERLFTSLKYIKGKIWLSKTFLFNTALRKYCFVVQFA